MNRYQQLRMTRGVFGYRNRETTARSGRDLVRVSRRSGRVTYSGSPVAG